MSCAGGLNDLMESKGGKKKSSSSKSLFYEAPLGYSIEDIRPAGGIKKFRSAAYSNVSLTIILRSEAILRFPIPDISSKSGQYLNIFFLVFASFLQHSSSNLSPTAFLSSYFTK
ncbi:hypothetical protein RHGRI_023160 [Rhododendron griersonianum]|uniref:Uncharacterized protein n=1 Tax=Rhododendron griersonianum TaxID=479676 RepID=A0AAV6J7Z1_9ERIC|nr:hypothetical protein RHGRI_023160 [Rhododendron griersonianum]KAG5535290.1 hypothetical protein RHGRI_023160 [Rhododendron griersonianum]